jgi:hypothetical protein
MRNRRRHTADAVERLRLAIDCMPVATREAMLAGVRGNERVIVGAYVDDRGGVCPMLAAHRCGQRTDFLSFARSWDRFTRAGHASRQATPRELRILVTQLEDSLSQTTGLELDEAIEGHRALRSRTLRSRLERSRAVDANIARSARAALPDAADPTGEILARRLLGRPRRPRPEQTVDGERRDRRRPVACHD